MTLVTAVAQVRSLAQELLHAADAAKKKKKGFYIPIEACHLNRCMVLTNKHNYYA